MPNLLPSPFLVALQEATREARKDQRLKVKREDDDGECCCLLVKKPKTPSLRPTGTTALQRPGDIHLCGLRAIGHYSADPRSHFERTIKACPSSVQPIRPYPCAESMSNRPRAVASAAPSGVKIDGSFLFSRFEGEGGCPTLHIRMPPYERRASDPRRSSSNGRPNAVFYVLRRHLPKSRLLLL